MERFGIILKKARKEQEWTLEKLANRLGTYKGYISGIESGKVPPPSIKFVAPMARILKLDARELSFLAWAEKAPKPVRTDATAMFESWIEEDRPTFPRTILSGLPVFGDILRAARRKIDLTLDEVADKSDVHKGYISGLETGRFSPPSEKALKPIMKALIMSEEFLPMLLLGTVFKGPKVIQKELVSGFLAIHGKWAKEVPQAPRTKVRNRPDSKGEQVSAFAQRVREARERIDMPQMDLASRIGVSQGLISAMERGAVPPTKDKARLRLLARFLKEDYVVLKDLAHKERERGMENRGA